MTTIGRLLRPVGQVAAQYGIQTQAAHARKLEIASAPRLGCPTRNVIDIMTVRGLREGPAHTCNPRPTHALHHLFDPPLLSEHRDHNRHERRIDPFGFTHSRRSITRPRMPCRTAQCGQHRLTPKFSSELNTPVKLVPPEKSGRFILTVTGDSG